MVCVSLFDVAAPQLLACRTLPDYLRVIVPMAAGSIVALAIDYCLPSDVDTTVAYFEGMSMTDSHIYPLPEAPSPRRAVVHSTVSDVERGLSPHRTESTEHYGVRERDRTGGSAALSVQPRAPPQQAVGESKARRRLHQHWRLAILMFTALTLHNLPEGVGVALSSMGGGTVGASLALAVAVHNAPEGLAIAVPVFAATKSRWAALAASILSGLSEPVGAVLTLLVMHMRGQSEVDQAGAPSRNGNAGQGAVEVHSVSSQDVDVVLSGVAGIMLTVSFVGLLPASLGYAAVPRTVHAFGFLAGLMLIAATIAAA